MTRRLSTMRDQKRMGKMIRFKNEIRFSKPSLNGDACFPAGKKYGTCSRLKVPNIRTNFFTNSEFYKYWKIILSNVVRSQIRMKNRTEIHSQCFHIYIRERGSRTFIIITLLIYISTFNYKLKGVEDSHFLCHVFVYTGKQCK